MGSGVHTGPMHLGMLWVIEWYALRGGVPPCSCGGEWDGPHWLGGEGIRRMYRGTLASAVVFLSTQEIFKWVRSQRCRTYSC
jgi:hypothetical protein